MGIQLTIDQDLKGFDRFLNNYRNQLPFASSVAINNTAFDIRTALNKGTLGAFDRPTKFTQKAFLVQKSKKNNLVAHTFAQDQAGKDRARYLRFGVKGGQRIPKGFEKYFAGLPNDGTIPSNSYFYPTSFIKYDKHGNVTRSTLKRISSGISNNPRGGFFIGTPANNPGKPAGIYKRSKEKLFPFFIASTRKPNYQSIFNIEQIAGKVVQRKFNQHFDKAMSKAIETRK
mgnify:CR=1 FL=1|tara:strand:- start:491 stop:1177 length:687 start_codon:yes stop_codon:yes gene_type:complete